MLLSCAGGQSETVEGRVEAGESQDNFPLVLKQMRETAFPQLCHSAQSPTMGISFPGFLWPANDAWFL